MFKNKNNRILFENNISKQDFIIRLIYAELRFISIHEITKIIINETLEEIRLSDGYGNSNSPKSFLLDLQAEFINFFSLWKNEYSENEITIDIYSKIGDLVPIIKPWSKSKYLEIAPGKRTRTNRINTFSNPLDKNNSFGGTLYYPFPLLTRTEHNHTSFILFEESIVDKRIKDIVYKTYSLKNVSYILDKVYFNKNRLVLKDIEINKDTNEQLHRLQGIIKTWPWFAVILFNCIFNEDWKIINRFQID
ncbi:hypothetical protein SSYRP_v1c04460 [Spiroplasma syrphidicola EA-1]|uniref:Uncharacterized protein n=1 Tax=Spiroplasma syrphidicola EA-1 TaxID=1276229 RepID=R4U611_9MOLU|nr:hypothetical protein [Spiroplasma syrphidicola]AGM26038.1 hypothetical protein SSYRP_v1c04460 [Spiroplasma syrphidicola EA-1]